MDHNAARWVFVILGLSVIAVIWLVPLCFRRRTHTTKDTAEPEKETAQPGELERCDRLLGQPVGSVEQAREWRKDAAAFFRSYGHNRTAAHFDEVTRSLDNNLSGQVVERGKQKLRTFMVQRGGQPRPRLTFQFDKNGDSIQGGDRWEVRVRVVNKTDLRFTHVNVSIKHVEAYGNDKSRRQNLANAAATAFLSCISPDEYDSRKNKPLPVSFQLMSEANRSITVVDIGSDSFWLCTDKGRWIDGVWQRDGSNKLPPGGYKITVSASCSHTNAHGEVVLKVNLGKRGLLASVEAV